MIERTQAINELNTKITFISSDYLNKHPKTANKLEEQHAFDDFMATPGEIVTLLKEHEIMMTTIQDMISVYKQELKDISDKNMSNPAKLNQFDRIQGRIEALEAILNNHA